jgi:hypothetical protein
MIPQQLLTLTDSRAPGIVAYGGPGLYKTNAIHTLPPPVLSYDIGEGGTASLMPWIRRKRNSNSDWVNYSQELRDQAFNLLSKDIRDSVKIKPAPLIDVIHYDNLRFKSYDEFKMALGSFDPAEYNSLALDSLQEFSVGVQTYAKGEGAQIDKLMTEVDFGWSAVQERSAQILRKLRNYRSAGVFIYMTAAEDISKEYVRSPREKREKGSPPPEPYSIRGTVNVPGKLVEALAHLPDILCHARLVNGKPIWVTQPEPITGGDAFWDAKDRFGRLDKYELPNFRAMCVKLYGLEVAKAIYAHGESMI